jgi:tripartite ATP-independent transporter DctP family solute receptor
MKKMLTICMIAILAVIGAGCDRTKTPEAGSGEFKAQYKLAIMTPATHTYALGAQKYADLIRERTNGRIVIQVYPDGQLGKGERELLEAVQQGTIDLYVGSTGPVGGFSQSMQLLDIPFLFRDYAHVDAVLDGPIGKQLLNDLEKADLKGLAFWENGFRNLTNSRQPVKTPDDARGLKIRTMENKVHIAAWKAAGVNPSPMAWGEVYGALQQKVIDGQENPVAVISTSKINEVQKYLSMTQHVYSPAPIIMSLKKWQMMPPADQELFLQTALEVAAYQRQLGRETEQKTADELSRKGMQITTDVDKAGWRKAMEPAFREFSEQFGKERIDAILQTK